MRELRVADRFRTNLLSKKPGGSIIKVIYSKTKRSFIYDKVKYPYYYIAKIHSDDIRFGRVAQILCDGEEMDVDRIINTADKKGW